MRSALWAEWIIARLTDRRRAASIVGDLLETSGQKGFLGFWLSVTRVVLSFIWRPTTAFIAACCFGLIGRRIMILALVHAHAFAWLRAISGGDPSAPLFAVVWFGNVLWMAASYVAIRYGLRDKVAQFALGFCGLVTVVMYYRPIVGVAVSCLLLTLIIVVGSVRSAQHSRSLAALTAAVVVGFGGGLLLMYSRNALIEYWQLGHHAPVLATFSISVWISAVWITTTACARIHDRLVRDDSMSEQP